MFAINVFIKTWISRYASLERLENLTTMGLYSSLPMCITNIYIQCFLLPVRHSCRCLQTFVHSEHLCEVGSIIAQIYWWRNWGMGRGSDLPNVTLVWGRARPNPAHLALYTDDQSTWGLSCSLEKDMNSPVRPNPLVFYFHSSILWGLCFPPLHPWVRVGVSAIGSFSKWSQWVSLRSWNPTSILWDLGFLENVPLLWEA